MGEVDATHSTFASRPAEMKAHHEDIELRIYGPLHFFVRLGGSGGHEAGFSLRGEDVHAHMLVHMPWIGPWLRSSDVICPVGEQIL